MIPFIVPSIISGFFSSSIDFVKEYKKPLLFLAVIGGLLFIGYWWGAADVKADWDKQIADFKVQADKQKEEWKAKADNIANEYQSYKSKNSIAMVKLRKEGSHEISSNRTLNDCNATAKFVRIYEAAGTGVGLSATAD